MKILSMPATRVHVAFVRDTIKAVLAKGVDLTPLFRECHIDQGWLDGDDDRYIPLPDYALLQQRLMAMLDDELMGHGGGIYRVGRWKFACRASLSEGTLGQVLQRLTEFYDLFDGGLRLQLSCEGEEAVFDVLPPRQGARLERFVCELMFTALYRFSNWLVRERIRLASVSFEQAGERPPADYAWMFQAERVSFGEGRTALRFHRRWLEAPVQRDCRSLESWLQTDTLGFYEEAVDDLSWAARLRELLGHHLPQLPELHEVAAELAINPHTLRRRLAAEGLSYQNIKDEVRREAAEYYLAESALSIEEIAFRSGFSEASCFIRAFKRWTGLTPHLYARQHRSEQPLYAAGAGRMG